MDPNAAKVSDQPSKVRLFLVVICGNLLSLSLGTCIGWTSPVMPKLKHQHDDSPLREKITKDQEGWIFSLIAVGAFSTAYIVGPLADRFGRKTAMIAASCIYIIAYTCLATARQLELIYIGRFLQGIAASTTMTVIPMYIGEIATMDKRGSALSVMVICMTFGMLYVYCIGPFTNYIIFQLFCMAIPFVSFGGYLFIPESPHYLVMKGETDLAAKALQRVRGQSLQGVQNELQEIQTIVERAKNMAKGTCSDILNNPGNRRALIIAVGVMICQQFSGAVIIKINSQWIFIEAGLKTSSAVLTICIGIVQTCSSSFLGAIVDRCKRRNLLRISAIGTGLAQFATGTFFYFHDNYNTPNIQWIPFVAFILFEISYRLGFGPLPFIILGESFPSNIKAIAASSVTLTCWGLGFMITRFYPLINSFGAYFIFWGFSVCCALSLLFTQYIVIETKGLSLIEIQDRLEGVK